MVVALTRTNSFSHQIDRAQLGAATSKTMLVRAARLSHLGIFTFIAFTFFDWVLSFQEGQVLRLEMSTIAKTWLAHR